MVKAPRGTRDFAPAETANRAEAARRLHDVFARYAYHEVQTPTFEELELFTAKSGPGIVSELYDFHDKGERHLTLRPELTAPVMRMYFAEHQFDAKPLKWYYHGNCFRYDRPQAGRYREFWQFGCEQIGAGTPLAYAELIALGHACFEALGVDGLDLRVGHVGVLRAYVASLGLDDDGRGALMRQIDKIDKDGVDPVLELLRGHGAEPAVFQALAAATRPGDVLGDWVDDDVRARLDELEETLAYLDAFEVPARLDLSIARGLDYYTGIVFEVHCDTLGAQSQVLGGGGYDLSGVLGGTQVPTMGFGLGFDRALVALESQDKTLAGPATPHVFLGAMGRAGPTVATVARRLRAAGLRTELDLIGRKFPKMFKHAETLGAATFVAVGDRDLEAGEVQVKDLQSGDTTTVAWGDLVAHLVGRFEA